MHHEQALPEGYRIEEYELAQVLGTGGFGITYLGYDTHLDIPVAIKEYLPGEFGIRRGDSSVVAKSSSDQGDFDWGLQSFLSEAKTLAKFKHPNLVQVHRYIEANHTAYIIMEYVEGDTLSERIKENQRHYSEQELKALLYPILDGLKKLHQQGIIHRDIKPANIIIRDSDESPVLIDFGAARNALGHKSKSITSIISPGYSPEEQYHSSGEQGTWTDIYSLGAVAYKCLTGEEPVESPARFRNDPLTPAIVKAKGQASESFLQGIDAALAPFHEDRPQTIGAWKEMLEGEQGGGAVRGKPEYKYRMPVDSKPKNEKPEPITPEPGMSWKKIGLILLVPIILLGLIFVQHEPEPKPEPVTPEPITPEPVLDNAKSAKALMEEADEFYFTKANYEQAFVLYEQAAELGSLSAKASLAKLWALGRGTGKNMGKARDYSDQSFGELKSQAERGFAAAQYQLGNLYTFIKGNDRQAVEWYRAAAEQGDANAQNMYAWMYDMGKGVDQSVGQALKWYRKAAEQGHARGQTNLGVMYANARGVQRSAQSDDQALKLYRMAAEQGYVIAINKLEKACKVIKSSHCP